jgi:hypothetical protein
MLVRQRPALRPINRRIALPILLCPRNVF